MEEYRIGVKPLRDGWWPDIEQSTLDDRQRLALSAEHWPEEAFATPYAAVWFIVRVLGLWKWPS